jgi:hypothetical protein
MITLKNSYMKNKIKFSLGIGLLLAIISLSSCLRHDLPAYPIWDGNYINNVYMEYRYNSDQMYDGKPVVANQRLSVSQTIDSTNNTISIAIAVPPASGSFTDSIRDLVSQTNLWPYFDLSTAATLTPVGNTPDPGNATDFSKPQSYVATAANGQKRTWTIVVTSFTK